MMHFFRRYKKIHRMEAVDDDVLRDLTAYTRAQRIADGAVKRAASFKQAMYRKLLLKVENTDARRWCQAVLEQQHEEIDCVLDDADRALSESPPQHCLASSQILERRKSRGRGRGASSA